MPKKRFVSLVFSPQRVQILQLDSTQKIVKISATVDLPEGAIHKYQLVDQQQVAGLIRQTWGQLGLTEKSVGVVIPEFSTFTKTLNLPKELGEEELDEAVRWQAQAFFPSDSRLVLDWKIIGEKEKVVDILVMAVPEEFLASYVSVVELAGLFPLAVETSSLALGRIVNGSGIAKLIAFANYSEAILAVVHGKEIVVSSVLGPTDYRGIIWTAQQMLRQYQKLPVQAIEIGGSGMTEELQTGLNNISNLSVEWIKVDLTGVPPEIVQEYLIPIASQFLDPAEPESEKTINLLPPKWSQFYRNQQFKTRFWSLALVSSVVIWACFLLASGMYLWLLSSQRILQSQLAVRESVIPQEVVAQVREANRLADTVIKIKSLSVSPREILSKIEAKKPLGITLTHYQMNLDNGLITLEGVAEQRETLIRLKQELEQDGQFSQVSIPISSLEAETNLQFELRLVFKPLASGPRRLEIN